MGATEVGIENIDINPFSAVVRIRGLQASDDNGAMLTVSDVRANLDWLPLWRHNLYIRNIELHDAQIDILRRPDGSFQIGGIALDSVAGTQVSPDMKPAANEPPWGLGIGAIGVTNVQINYRDTQNNIVLDLHRLSSTELASWKQDQTLSIDIDGVINNAPMQIHSEIVPFASVPGAKAEIRLDNFDLSSFSILASDQGLTELRGQVDINLMLSLLVPDTKNPSLNTSGTVGVRDFHIASNLGVIDNEALTWKGKASYGPHDNVSAAGVHMVADTGIKNLRITTPDQRHSLLELGVIELSGVALDEYRNISIKAITIDKLSALAGATVSPSPEDSVRPPVLSIEAAEIKDVALTGMNELAINHIDVTHLNAELFIEKNGAVRGVDVLSVSRSESAPQLPANETLSSAAVDESPRASMSPQLRLQSLTIGGDSSIRFEDHSVRPPFRAELRPFELKAANIDTGNPATRGSFEIRTQLGRYTPIAFSGTINPVADAFGLDLQATIEALDLPPLSPYTVKYTGYNLKRGNLDSNITLRTEAGKLNATGKLKLRKFKLEAKDPEQSKTFSEQLAMPLDASLNLLRDKNDNIMLEIQVGGDINAPDFDFSKIINRALGNAVKMASLRYASTILQPWGSLMTIANVVGKATALRFEPIIFSPGAQIPSSEMSAYLDKLVALLTDRPTIQLTICGKAAAVDRNIMFPDAPPPDDATAALQPVLENIKEQLLALAEQRGNWVKESLVTAGGIDPARLLTCRPTIDEGESAIPRVELYL